MLEVWTTRGHPLLPRLGRVMEGRPAPSCRGLLLERKERHVNLSGIGSILGLATQLLGGASPLGALGSLATGALGGGQSSQSSDASDPFSAIMALTKDVDGLATGGLGGRSAREHRRHARLSAKLVSDAAFLAALGTARTVRFSAYVLNAETAVAHGLEGAAAHGARVDVVLDGAPFGERPGIVRANAAASAALVRAGARVHQTTAGGPAMHLKAALIDGVAYLDDRNWASGERDTIVALDDPAAVAAVASALDGRPVGSGSLATEKRAALDLEAAAIHDAPGDRVDVETESFGATVVSKALAARAAHGTRVRLLVSEAELRGPAGLRERRALARLAAGGVVIEATANTEKLCVAGDEVWIGSANATFSPEPSLDWGLRSRDPALVAGVSRAFERNWLAGRSPSMA